MSTLTATNTIYAVWIFPNGNIQLASLLTDTAAYTFFRIDMVAIQCKTVKETVNSTQWAQISAKRSVDHYGGNQDQHEDRDLPSVEPTDYSFFFIAYIIQKNIDSAKTFSKIQILFSI